MFFTSVSSKRYSETSEHPSTRLSPDLRSSEISQSDPSSPIAYFTPSPSLSGGDGESQHPSAPPSPNSQSFQTQSTLAAALAVLRTQNPNAVDDSEFYDDRDDEFGQEEYHHRHFYQRYQAYCNYQHDRARAKFGDNVNLIFCFR